MHNASSVNPCPHTMALSNGRHVSQNYAVASMFREGCPLAKYFHPGWALALPDIPHDKNSQWEMQ